VIGEAGGSWIIQNGERVKSGGHLNNFKTKEQPYWGEYLKKRTTIFFPLRSEGEAAGRKGGWNWETCLGEGEGILQHGERRDETDLKENSKKRDIHRGDTLKQELGPN